MNPSPGPWRWVKGHWDLLGLFSRAAGEERCVLQAGSSQDIHAYNADDAALIAAAPEMREMLLKLEWKGMAELEHTGCAICQEWEPAAFVPAGVEPRSGIDDHREGCPLGALLERIR